MHINIQNLGKMQKADIELDGITLIVGDNNMGKTTVGRVLYAFFNSLYRIDKEVGFQRVAQVWRTLRRFYERFRRHPGEFWTVRDFVEKYVQESNDNGESIIDFVRKSFGSRVTESDLNGLLEKIEEIKGWSNTSVRKQIIREYFDRIFGGQCVSIDHMEEGGYIHAQIDGHEVNVDFRNDDVLYDSTINLQQNAYFIDSPDVLDVWGRFRMLDSATVMKPLTFSFRRSIEKALSEDKNPADSAFDNLIFGERYNKFVDELRNIMGGCFEFDSNGVLRFVENREMDVGTTAFDLNNVSEGLKSFGIIELMLRYRILHDGDVLIFDEPEIHLHPEWQLKYAEILVGLQKEFKLKILITTHSANFLMAMQFFSKVSKRESIVKSYRITHSKCNRRYSVLESENPADWDDSYLSFIRAAHKLDELREKAFAEEED